MFPFRRSKSEPSRTAQPVESRGNNRKADPAKTLAARQPAAPTTPVASLRRRPDGAPWVIMPAAKGGSAKSTTMVNLAVLAAHAGLRVLILDTDQQGSVSVWADRRAKQGQTKRVDVQHCIRGDTATYLAKAKGHYDLVLIDTPPNLNEETGRLVGLSHLVLVTAAPYLFDVAETMRLTRWLNTHRVRPLIVLTNTPADRLGQPAPVVADTRRALEGWRQQRPGGTQPLKFRLWDGHVSRRLAVPHALTTGQAVMEFEAASQAAEDFRRLWAYTVRVLESSP